MIGSAGDVMTVILRCQKYDLDNARMYSVLDMTKNAAVPMQFISNSSIIVCDTSGKGGRFQVSARHVWSRQDIRHEAHPPVYELHYDTRKHHSTVLSPAITANAANLR